MITEKYINTILDDFLEGIIILNDNLNVVYANSVSEVFLEKTIDELVNKKFEFPVLKSGYNEIRIVKNQDQKYLELHFKKTRWQNKAAILVHIKDVTENRLIEEKLLKKSEMFQAFHDFSPICIQSLNVGGIIVSVNLAWLKTLEYKKAQVVGKSFINLLHADYENKFRHCFEKLKDQGFIKGNYLRLKKADGYYIDVEFDGTVGYNTLGEIEQVYCVFKDITKQKTVERSLNRQMSILEEAEDISRIGHWELDLLHNKFFFSDSIYNIFEINKELKTELSFEDFLGIVHPDDRVKVQTAYHKSVHDKNPKVIEHKIITGGGKEKFIQEKFKTEYNRKGFPIRSLGMVVDITDSKKMLKDLEKSERTLSVLMKNLPGMAYRCKNDSDYTMLFVSDGCRELIGYAPEELVNNNVISYKEIIHPNYQDMVDRNVEEAIKKNDQFQLEYKIVTKEGKERWVWEKGTGIMSDSGNIEVLEGFISDISDLKRAEHEIIVAKEEAERSNQLKSSFLANMSHEIRTPMNSIVGFSRLLLQNDLTEEKKTKYVEIINNSGEQLLSIIGDILDIARIETGNIEIHLSDFNLYDFIESIYDSYLLQVEMKNLIFRKRIELKSENKIIKSDKTKLEQIISNLLNNALKFTDKGGIEIACVESEDYYYLSISDTGIGIKTEEIDAIFDRFNKGEIDITNKYGGTGLGLAICKAFVETLGGEIWVESEFGKGSCFSFSLPRNEKKLESR